MVQSAGSMKPLTRGWPVSMSKFRGSIWACTPSLPAPQNAFAAPANQDVQTPEVEMTHQKQGPGSSVNQRES